MYRSVKKPAWHLAEAVERPIEEADCIRSRGVDETDGLLAIYLLL
jgi:hypothetical protein